MPYRWIVGGGGAAPPTPPICLGGGGGPPPPPPPGARAHPDETLGVVLSGGAPPLAIDEEARIVHVYGLPIQLTTLEYELLDYLACQPRKVCTREECFLAVWHQPYDHLTCEHALNACIARLRRNLRAAALQVGLPPPEITTIKRVGFRLDSEVRFTAPSHRPFSMQERAVGK